jgi:hypothetical protein
LKKTVGLFGIQLTPTPAMSLLPHGSRNPRYRSFFVSLFLRFQTPMCIHGRFCPRDLTNARRHGCSVKPLLKHRPTWITSKWFWYKWVIKGPGGCQDRSVTHSCRRRVVVKRERGYSSETYSTHFAESVRGMRKTPSHQEWLSGYTAAPVLRENWPLFTLLRSTLHAICICPNDPLPRHLLCSVLVPYVFFSFFFAEVCIRYSIYSTSSCLKFFIFISFIVNLPFFDSYISYIFDWLY